MGIHPSVGCCDCGCGCIGGCFNVAPLDIPDDPLDPRYALVDHEHDERYALIDHDHDNRYSLLDHLHDDRYSLLDHNHDDRYYTKPEVDALIPVIPDIPEIPPSYYHYGSFAVGDILASEILMDHIAATDHTLANDFGLNVASVGTPPASGPWVADVQLNGVSVGSMTIGVNGVANWLTTGDVVNVVAGNTITLIAPPAVDNGISRLRFTFKGLI